MNTENRQDDYIDVIYQDGDKVEKNLKIEKVPITEYNDVNFTS
jgi:hypothetical protein